MTIPVAWPRSAARVVIAFCIMALVATGVASTTVPTQASGLSSQISATRAGQLYAERAMRAQDGVITNVKADQKRTKRELKRDRRELKQVQRALALVKVVLSERRARYARVDALHEDPADAPVPEDYKARLTKLRREIRVAERRKKYIASRVRTLSRVVRAKEARLRSLKRQRAVAISRRESAEDQLAYRIITMTDLAAARAANQTAVSVGSSSTFSWPTTGRISQRYGCTGFRLNPRRGSCRHFHDGIDIVDAQGTPVRAVAVGVVAYAGWNPWDERGRAWIVVVAHPNGFVSRYGHMVPTDRVRPGELVHTGQIIGKMGNTGRSTGTHLHFELLVNGKDVNPASYLPTGVIKVDKKSTKQGLQKAKAKKKAKQKARKQARAKRRAKARAEEALALAAAEACDPVAPPLSSEDMFTYVFAARDPGCEPVDVADDVEPSADGSPSPTLGAAEDPAAAEPPGVPLPLRGTSPLPS